MLLKLNLVLFFMLSVGIVNVNGQIPEHLASRTTAVISPNADNTAIYADATLNEYSIKTYQSLPELSSRPVADAFDCESGLVYIITNEPSANGNISGLYSYDLGTKTQTLIKDPLVESTNSSQFINAIGYNIIDDFIYGHLQGTDQVTKIDASGNIEFLTITGDFIVGDYSSGDVDKNGILYIYGRGRLVAINLNPGAPDFMEGKTVLTFSRTFHDLAFNPVDDNMYMMTSDSSRTLLRYDVNSNEVVTLGRVAGLEAETTNSFGTAFMDNMGNLYVSNNASGNIYKIASPHTGGLVATSFSTLSGTPGDGARCPNASVPPNAVDDIACGLEGDDIIIDLIQNDGEGTYAFNLSTLQLIDPITAEESNTITVAGQGTFTVDANGIMTFTPQDSFTEASIYYKLADEAGFVSNQATITVSLNRTSAPTGSSVQTFCPSETPTIADLSASGTSILWYSSEDGTSPLSPSHQLQETTYYATQTSESGCESVERLAVTVEIISDLEVVNTERLSCINSNTAYIVEIDLNGREPHEVSGHGAPGRIRNNNNGTFTWISDPILASVTHYNVEFSTNCGNLTIEGEAPYDCLATPFSCDDGLAIILTNTGTEQSNYVTGLYTLNLTTNVQNLVKYPLIEEDEPYRFINAIGYNILDNYIYGLLQRTNKIARIDTSGDVELFDIIGDFTPGFYSSGDMDNNGNLYLYNGKKFVLINLNPSNPDYLVAIDLAEYSASVNDLVFNPIDGNIYMVTSTSTPRLLRFNIATNTVENLGNIVGLGAETTSSYGTAFMDISGNVFIANNGSGNIYKISSPHNGGITAEFYSDAMEGLQPGDGARCLGEILFPIANDDTVCGIPGNDTVIDVLANDTPGTFAIDINSVKLIDPVSGAQVTSATIAGQGTFTVEANGTVTFSALSTNTEASIEYIIKDLLANESQPATILVRNDTLEVVCPTFDDLTVECYEDLPNKFSYSVAEFEALGNGNGAIEACGIVVISAKNSRNTGECKQTVTRTYTITEYQDTNGNGVLDEDETIILNTFECIQIINIEDTTAPSLVTDYEEEISITCDIIPLVPELVFEDACSNNIEVSFTETSTNEGNSENYVITRTWTVTDLCDNEAIFTQTINVDLSNPVVGSDIELCNDEDIEFDLFSLLSGNYDVDGIWTVESDNTTLDGHIFNPYQKALATYTFKYTTEGYCPTETIVNIRVTDDCVVLPCGVEDVVISKAVTTYADGKNDYFTITGVETCGFTYEVQIFNRWGALIYESKDYQNDWNGTTSKASVGSSNYVPTGTYYYVVNLKNSGLKPFAGPIYVATK